MQASFNFAGFSLRGVWEPDDAERAAAWELLVELSTRTTMLDLADEDGSVRGALSSLYSIFGSTRELLRSYGPSIGAGAGNGNLSLGVIAVRVLNDVIRPVTSKWHVLLDEHEERRPAGVGPGEWERSWCRHDEVRRDLAAIRPIIRQYVLVLAEVAQVSELSDAVLTGKRLTLIPVDARTGPPDPLPDDFEPREAMVRWFNLRVLAVSGWRIFRMPKIDRRESFPTLLEPDADYRSTDEAFWFDYVADLGDAFDPTMAVAWWLCRDRLECDDHDLPDGGLHRGPLLLMGGDEVYPYPSTARYRNQLTGPYEAAMAGQGPRDVLATPGNHDWYDNLDGYVDVFLKPDSFAESLGRPEGQSGFRTPQQSPWFSARLPHGWNVWGFDPGLSHDLNERQQAHFREMARSLDPGKDQLILCTPVPWWRLREKRAPGKGFDDELARLTAFLDEVLPEGVPLRLCLSGDTHIYSHHRSQSRSPRHVPVHHITSGGGGAFLHPTHNLAPQVPQGTEEDPWFQLEEHWPARSVSKHELARSSRGLALDRQNLSLGGLLAGLHLLYGLLVGRAATSDFAGQSLWRAVLDIAIDAVSSVPGWLYLAALVVVFALGGGPSVGEPDVVRAARRYGAVHGLFQCLVMFVSAVAGSALALILVRRFGGVDADWSWLSLPLAAVIGAFFSTVVIAHYLRIANQHRRIHDTSAFSGRHLTGYKHFVRMRIDPKTGDLDLYVVGLAQVQRGWSKAMKAGTRPPHGFATLVDTIHIERSAA